MTICAISLLTAQRITAVPHCALFQRSQTRLQWRQAALASNLWDCPTGELILISCSYNSDIDKPVNSMFNAGLEGDTGRQLLLLTFGTALQVS